MTSQTPTLRQTPFALPTFNRESVIVSLLAILTLVGGIAGVGRLFLGLGSTTALSDVYSWGIWIGFDFLLIALSGVGFTMAAVVHVLHLEQFKPALRPAILFGLLGYVAVLLLLVLDLGRPDRFYHFILFWNVHSPLFEISWCVLLYTTVLAIEVSPYLSERLGWRKPLAWFFRLITPVTIVGVTLSSLHQSTLGTLYLNMPHRLHALWYTPLLPLLFFVSSVLAGLSVAMLVYQVAVRIRRKPLETSVLTGLGKGVAGVALFYLLLKLADILIAGKVAALFAFDRPSWLMWAELLPGVLLPALLLGLPSLRRKPLMWWVAPLLVVVFAIGLNRFNATLFAQVNLPGDALYTPHLLEWLSTFGILSAAALAWYVGMRLLVIFDSRAEKEFGH
ncbi:MAG: polysulfide reductase NrfD [Caldilineales bacterium]|nr:polysulfide reductase NrfD [Caldilineales bacterium]